MNAPLSRYLTRFSTQAAAETVPLVVAPPRAEPMLTLAVAALDVQLASARAEARTEAEAVHAQALAALAARHEATLAEAVVAARAERSAAEAEALLAHVEGALVQLRETLAEGIAKVLRPLVVEAVRVRALDALDAALAQLLADPAHPAVTLRAPENLVAAIRARGVPGGVELVVADIAEAEVSADGTKIETRLGQALAELAASEG